MNNNEIKTVVSYSFGIYKFSVMFDGLNWTVAVMKHNGLEYRCVDVGSCESEAEARQWAWSMASPDGYKG